PYGANVKIRFHNPSGETFDSQMFVGARSGASNNGCTSLTPVCVKTAGVTVSDSDPSLVTGTTLNNSTVVDCSTAQLDGTFYYLSQYFMSNATTRTAYQYQLIRSDGFFLRSDNANPPTPALVNLTAIEAADSSTLGPASAAAQLPDYNIANPR